MSGHESLGHFLQHHARLDIGSVTIDLQLELTFFAEQSALERRRIDTNRDARLAPSEIVAYARRLGRVAEDRIRISVDGKPVAVVTQFEPELELFGGHGRAGGGHVVRLFLFARTPRDLLQNGVVEIRDGLWSDWPAMYFLDPEGVDGIETIPTAVGSGGAQFYDPDERRLFRVRYRRVGRRGNDDPIVDATTALRGLQVSFGETATGDKAPQGAAELAAALVRGSSHLFSVKTRQALDEINRQVREGRQAEEQATSDEARAKAVARENSAAIRLVEILSASGVAIHLKLAGKEPSRARIAPAALSGDTGSFLFRVATGDSETRCTVADVNISKEHGVIEIEAAASGITWALLRLRGVPVSRTALRLEFRLGSDRRVALPFEVTSPRHGRLKLTVLSDDDGTSTPAMVRLTGQRDGQPRRPGNAVEFASQWNGIGTSDRRNAILPGKLRGQYWCVPGPVDMALPPGEWHVIVRRGLEHETVFDTFSVRSEETVEKTYRPRRWVDMRQAGWYSGDDHVHCQILSDTDARRLMSWVQAEDIHLTNVVKMGDIHKTYFEQRGFGKPYRVIDRDYILSPGQECPRTDAELGHTLAMNITSMVRDTEKYFLYDWVFDTVHAQGGLSGYAHVNRGLFHVHRDMSINIPKGKVDFAELLQFGSLKTQLYYEFLNTGFRLTASAGSDVPWGGTVGEARMFAHVGDRPFSADSWFDAVRRGNTFVTNGPMLELRVDSALPGDTIVLTKDRRLSVRVRAWGDARRVLPSKLELVSQGEVIARAEASKGEHELKIDLDLNGGHGFWIAARADGTDGSRAHTTPIYVVRESLRFWKFDEVEDLMTKRSNSLAEVEQIVADAIARNERGEVEDNRTIKQLALQGPRLLERVEVARQLYEELKRTYDKEKPLRRRQ